MQGLFHFIPYISKKKFIFLKSFFLWWPVKDGTRSKIAPAQRCHPVKDGTRSHWPDLMRHSHKCNWVLFLHKFADLHKFPEYTFHKFVELCKYIWTSVFVCISTKKRFYSSFFFSTNLWNVYSANLWRNSTHGIIIHDVFENISLPHWGHPCE